jgi:hypothetical protein
MPAQIRFLHEPTAPHAYVGAALSSNIIHIHKAGEHAGPRCKCATSLIQRCSWIRLGQSGCPLDRHAAARRGDLALPTTFLPLSLPR